MELYSRCGKLNQDAVVLLHKLSTDSDERISGDAFLARIRLLDNSAILGAAEFVESPKRLEQYRQAIAHEFRRLTASEHLSNLAVVMNSKEVLLRRGASYALRESESKDQRLLFLLAQHLDDSDVDVRYNVLIGMGSRCGVPSELRPSYSRYLENPEIYISGLKQWWADNREKSEARNEDVPIFSHGR